MVLPIRIVPCLDEFVRYLIFQSFFVAILLIISSSCLYKRLYTEFLENIKKKLLHGTCIQFVFVGNFV
jgi:hypothetical protein